MSMVGWLTGLIRRRRDLDDADFQDEIRAHLALAEADRIADGADRQTARDAALKAFGNVTLTTEAARRVWTPRWLEAARDGGRDLRHIARTLARNRGFSFAVIGVLTLGIALNVAVFTMLKGIALSPLAGVADAARLVVVYGETSEGRGVRVSYPDYRYLRDHDTAFAALFGSSLGKVNVGRGRGARQLWAEIVTGNYFTALGVRASRGRTLLPSDEVAPGGHPVVVISEGLWQREFGGDPDIVGRTIEINEHPVTVVGVVAPAFHGTTVVYDTEVFIPVMMAPWLGFNFGSQQTTPSGVLADRRATLFFPQGYLRPGTTLAHAATQIATLWTALAREHALADRVTRPRVVPFWRMPQGAPSIMLPTLGVVTAMGLLVLTIACANIAGLVLVRGLSRRGEIAARVALGATRARIVRLLLAENLVLAGPGVIGGVLLGRRAIDWLVGYAERLALPERVFFNVEVDGLVIGFAVVVACACVLVFGFIPALRSSRVELVSVINEDASPRGASRGRWRTGLVVVQVAVSLVLLIAAGLVARSLEAARRADPGFDPNRVAVVAVDVKQNRYDEAAGRIFYRDLVAAARADAGVESAAVAAFQPLGFLDTPLRRVTIDGYEPRRGEDLAFMSNVVGSSYFRTLRIPLRAGREFADRDDQHAEWVTIVNDTLARRFWGGAAHAIGRRIRVGDDWRTVIGVAADVKYSRLDESPRPYFYLPFHQAYRSSMVLHTRGPGPIGGLVDRGRAQVAALDADLPVLYAESLVARINEGALILLNLAATMLFAFGLAGMALTAMGTYGLVSYTVRQGMRETGIRMALGASRRRIVGDLLGRGLRLGVIGAAVGLIGALGAGRLVSRVLFGVSATDSVAVAHALLVVLATVVVATMIPAWRAARANPLRALRHH